jgi:NAD(P)-dependent dehydrogenase (short-subunit alcohol dehydrogenase family)
MSQAGNRMARTTSLSSFGDPCNIAIIGASGGIGNALLRQTESDPKSATLLAFSRSGLGSENCRTKTSAIELENESSIAEAASFAHREVGSLSAVIVGTGLLHDGEFVQPEKSLRMIDGYAFERLLRINTVGPALVAKHFIPLLRRDSKSVFACISARVGSIEDNRLGGWYAYRASKAALNMIIRTLSVELSRSNPNAVCVGLHPGTVDTDLSRPFQANVRPERLFTAEKAASSLLSVVDNLTPGDSGKIFAWDGTVIPY